MTEAQKAKQKKIEEAAKAAVQQERDAKQEKYDASEEQKPVEAALDAVEEEKTEAAGQEAVEEQKPAEDALDAVKEEKPEEDEQRKERTVSGSVEIVFAGLVNIRRSPKMEPGNICGQARTGQILNICAKTEDGGFYRLISGDYITADPTLVKPHS